MTQVNIKYFASLREALGPGERRETQAQTLGQLRDEAADASVHERSPVQGHSARVHRPRLPCNLTSFRRWP